jgi:hypothetical protein
LPQKVFLDDVYAYNGKEIVNLFAKYLGSVYVKSRLLYDDPKTFPNNLTHKLY